MIQIFNPSRLTRQPFFGELIRYLDQREDVILREIKAQFPDIAVDKLMEEYIKAGLIRRENKRYFLNLSFLESIDNLTLDQEIFIREDSPVSVSYTHLSFLISMIPCVRQRQVLFQLQLPLSLNSCVKKEF